MKTFAAMIGLSLCGILVGADRSLPPEFDFIPGPVNGAYVWRAGRSLAVYGDPSGQRPPPDMVLLTHTRRDVVWAARGVAQAGVTVVAPEQESAALTRPETFWEAWRERRFHDYAQQTSKMPVESMVVGRTVAGGDLLRWADLSVRVLDTPGYTRGAVSYLVEVGGTRVAFTGDLIRDDGRIEDLFSLQDAIPEAKVGGYHGWAGRLGALMTSLDRLAAENPAFLVPARGPIIADPLAAIDRLRQRIRVVYANYLSVDALRWYFQDDHIRAKARRVLSSDVPVDWMPMAETPPLPEAIVPIANARLILASDRSGFLVDCGGPGIIDELRKLQAAGRLTRVEHVFVTHYHDDHTDALPRLVSEFGCEVHACGSLIDLIEHPGDYRLPCLTKNPTPVTARHRDGDRWDWKEYRLTIFDFPGQTLHHNALLAELKDGWSACFVGDSFTPSGVDDYCLQNRNWLHEGQGFLRCLETVELLPSGCLLLNQHVAPPFRLTPAQIGRMRETLRSRRTLLAGLFPFDDPNYGLDEGWAVLHPYWVKTRPGDFVPLALRLTNHSPREHEFRTRVRVPADWRVTADASVRVAAHTAGDLVMTLQVGEGAASGLHVLVADVIWDGGELREWAEAVVEVVR